MEVYILDHLYRRTEVIDKFESLIWTERWDDIGDFELHIPSSAPIKASFLPDTSIAVNTSHRVMTVETVEDTLDEEARKILKIKGRSLEKITQERILLDTYAGYSLLPNYTVNNEMPAAAMRRMFNYVFEIGAIHPSDVLPLYVDGQTLFPIDTIPEPTDVVLQYLDPAMVYDGLRTYSQVYDLGWRLYRNYDNQQLFFNVYTGNNRTVRQSTFPAVVFSPAMENLQNTAELGTTEGAKNVAYVYCDVANSLNPDDDGFHSAVVYAPGVDSSITGADRRVMLINMGTIDPSKTGPVDAQLIRGGLDALAKAKAFRAFDGEVTQYTGYEYDNHYFLGDIVTMQNENGYMNDMRVTEQIMVSDRDGDRSYPTLSLRQFYTPGTWEQSGYRSWTDAGTTEYWANQL